MKKLSILVLLVLLLTMLAIPASANYAAGTLDTGHTWVFDEAAGVLTINGTVPASSAAATTPTPPTMPKVTIPQTNASGIPANLGSIIGVCLAGVLVIAVVVVVIAKNRKK